MPSDNAAELLPEDLISRRKAIAKVEKLRKAGLGEYWNGRHDGINDVVAALRRITTRAPSAEYRPALQRILSHPGTGPETLAEMRRIAAAALIPVSTADLDARHADRMRRSSWLLPHEAVDCNGECVIHAASPAPVSTAPESKFKAELIGHGLMKVERPASPTTVLHCSCGAAVTKEEYQQHRAAGHDASPATVPTDDDLRDAHCVGHDPKSPCAREAFAVGDPVRLSTTGIASNISASAPTGVVVGFGKDPNTLKVKCDGFTSGQPYHMKFWQRQHLGCGNFEVGKGDLCNECSYPRSEHPTAQGDTVPVEDK